jgi:GntR family transcriptional regulator
VGSVVKPVDLQVPIAHVQGRNHAVEAYRVLSEALAVGRYPSGTRLPGERTLASQLGVSRAMLRQVLTALADAGRLEPSPQRGWFVSERKLVHEPNRLRSFSELARESGMTPTARTIRVRVRQPTVAEAEALGIANTDEIVDLQRVRGLDGSSISVEYSCLPSARVPGIDRLDLTDCSLYDTLQEHYGIVATRIDYELQAEAVKARDGKHLGLAAGAAVLVGYQRTFDRDELCFDVGRQIYRGDAYRFKASLFRF